MVLRIHTALYTDTGCLVNHFLIEAGLKKDPRVELVLCEFSDVFTDEWAKSQPFNRMPYLEDTETGFKLFEVRVILRYISTKLGLKLAPPLADTPAYWEYQKMESVEMNHFSYNCIPLMTELLYAPQVFKKPSDQAVIKWHEADLAKCLKGYDRILADRKWLCGDEISLVDIFHANAGALVQFAGGAKSLSDGSFPNVARWWKELTDTAAYQAAAKEKMQAFEEFMSKGAEGIEH